jgi:ATP-dependent protease HslVU (ClpYQ) peptidase subunit
MTLIVGIDHGSEILVLADTRVSYGSRLHAPAPRDQLRKLVSIRLPQSQVILGFSGNIPEIQRVLRYVKRKAQYAPSSGSLMGDLTTFMEEPVGPRKQLSFMLCGFEPTGEPQIVVFGLTTTGEVVLRPDELFCTPQTRVAIIGSGAEFKEQIHRMILHPVGHPQQYQDFEAFSRVRSMMAETIISLWFQDRDAKHVGGPFAVYRLRRDGSLIRRYMLPLDEDSPDAEVTEDETKTVLYNPSTGKRYTLFSIFSYTDADFHAHEDACASYGRGLALVESGQ